MGIVVRLTPVDERLLTPLLSVAVAETKPDEVTHVGSQQA